LTGVGNKEDGFVKSPIPAFRCILRHCGVPFKRYSLFGIRYWLPFHDSRNIERLELGAFYFASLLMALYDVIEETDITGNHNTYRPKVKNEKQKTDRFSTPVVSLFIELHLMHKGFDPSEHVGLLLGIKDGMQHG